MPIIPVPSNTCFVSAARLPSVTKASLPQDCGIHTDSTPCLSASTAHLRTSSYSSSVPRLNPNRMKLSHNDQVYRLMFKNSNFETSYLVSVVFLESGPNSEAASSISLCESIERQNVFSYLIAFSFLFLASTGSAVVSILPFSGR